MTGFPPEAPLPSNQKFGWFLAAVFCLAATYAKWMSHSWWGLPLLGLAIGFAVLAMAAPKLLAPLNKLWFQLGRLLGSIVSPIVLGVVFFGLTTPVAVITRLAGRDELRIKKRSVSSYWVDREPTGPQPDSYNNQF